MLVHLSHARPAPLLVVLALLAPGCERGREIALTDLVAKAEKRALGAKHASFREGTDWTDVIRMGETTLPSITPPFPAELAFDVELPRHAQMELASGVMTDGDVRRARVRFQVELEVGGRSAEVYRRDVRPDEANTFHEARIDLGAWGGKPVRLTLRTLPIWGPSRVPWADRVLTVWGAPVIRPGHPTPLAPSKRPSFVFVLIDTLRADFLGAYGFDGPISPSIDRLAMESIVFENCFSNAPWTKPAIATLFTSLHPAAHGVASMGSGGTRRWEALSEEARTLAELLGARGYDTAAFVANPFVSPQAGFSQGFDVFEMTGKTRDLLTAATEWLKARAGVEAPFFLYLHFMDVHGPYDAARRDVETMLRVIDPSMERRLTETEYAAIPDYIREASAVEAEGRLQLRTWLARYAAGVLALDRRLGPFVDELRNSGVLDESYLILTSDHGEEFLEHGGWTHGGKLFDHQLRVPLLVRKPLAADAGLRVDGLVSLVDLMPTILTASGIEPPTGLEGRDLSSFLRGESAEEPSEVYASGVTHNPKVYAIRTKRHKLIWDAPGNEEELYDLLTDPDETVDRSAEDQASRTRLARKLREHLQETESRGPLSPETVPLSNEDRERLEALGYVP